MTSKQRSKLVAEVSLMVPECLLVPFFEGYSYQSTCSIHPIVGPHPIKDPSYHLQKEFSFYILFRGFLGNPNCVHQNCAPKLIVLHNAKI